MGSAFLGDVRELFNGVLSNFNGDPELCGGMLMGRAGAEGGLGLWRCCFRSLLFCTLDAFLRFSNDVLLGEGVGESFTFAFS